MIVIRAKMIVQPGKRDDFLRAVTQLVDTSRKIDGAVSYDICESITEPNTFLAMEIYEDDAAMNRQASSGFEKAWPLMEPCLEEPITATFYDVAGTRPVET